MTDHATTPISSAERARHLREHDEDTTALRLHLETDHDAALYEDDTDETLPLLHEGMHRQRITPPAPPADAPPAELVLARQEQEVERMRAAEAAYDVGTPTTLRQQLAYAKTLAGAGIIPRAFRSNRPGEDGTRETTANVFLAMQLGAVFGMHPLTALGSINVVEGKPGLGAEAQLAQALQAGHDVEVDSDESNDQQAVVHVQRMHDGEPVGKRHRVVYTLDDAVRAGLCRIVDGKPFARSSQGKPLPWEHSTPDMLVWRCITRACKRYLPDVTAGLATYDGGEGEHYAPQRAATVNVEQVPARVRPAQPAADDTVDADLALFPDGRWWEYTNANVRRRNKLQLAADRLKDAHLAGDERVPAPYADEDEPIDAEVVDEPGQPADVPEGDGPPSAAMRLAPIPGDYSEPVADVPADEAQQADVHFTLEGIPANAPADGPAGWSVPDDDGSAEDQPTDRRADLWQQVLVLAEQRGKTPTQLLARHVMATRKNPEDMDADDLAAFLDAQA